MTTIKLTAQTKQQHGSGISKRLRRDGFVPAVVYGVTDDVAHVSLDHNTVYHALKKASFHTSILSIDIGNKTEKVVLRNFQMHAFRPQVLHLDFQRVTEDKEIDIRIPLHFINEDTSHAVKVDGAHITKVIADVEIRALVANIPQYLEIDLKNLTAGQSIHLADIKLPDGVALTNLLRNDNAVVAIAAGIQEEIVETVAPVVAAAADVPSMKGDASKDEKATSTDDKNKDKK
jgi:large subunit ribosomal protein L25